MTKEQLREAIIDVEIFSSLDDSPAIVADRILALVGRYEQESQRISEVTNKNTIYIVIGSTGCYEDGFEWPVTWFDAEEEALKYSEKLNKISSYIKKERDSLELKYVRITENSELRKICEESGIYKLDPYFNMDYNGTHYSYIIVNKLEINEE